MARKALTVGSRRISIVRHFQSSHRAQADVQIRVSPLQHTPTNLAEEPIIMQHARSERITTPVHQADCNDRQPMDHCQSNDKRHAKRSFSNRISWHAKPVPSAAEGSASFVITLSLHVRLRLTCKYKVSSFSVTKHTSTEPSGVWHVCKNHMLGQHRSS